MNSYSFSRLLAAALGLTFTVAGLPALGQDDRKPVPLNPTPPNPDTPAAAPENPRRPQEPNQPPGPPLGGRGGFRDERHEGRTEPRFDSQRGPDEGRRPEEPS